MTVLITLLALIINSSPIKSIYFKGAEYQGRFPCHQALMQLHNKKSDCNRIKAALRIFDNHKFELDMVYVGDDDNKYKASGKWSVTKGTKTDAVADVYVLEFENQEGKLYWMKGDNNVLFLLDENKNLVVGDATFGYTFNRVKNL
ncbi:copper resistance protein NlpE N-terminal domain-containing protein [Pollutibacter soli]|uniref:copper resistance protein NlpE N-terminal domain-containing protein n=1 Tax=Pollutibacter soli TaxID=3034157 RepID=UPI0030132ECB